MPRSSGPTGLIGTCPVLFGARGPCRNPSGPRPRIRPVRSATETDQLGHGIRDGADLERRREAGIGDEVTFATRPQQVQAMIGRAVLAAGLVLLGAPALALPASSTMAAILAVSLVRGLGFAICVVVGGALVAAMVPPERRGEGLGLFGIVVGVPGVAALPLGVWLVGEAGYPPVFVAGAAAALAGLAVVPGLPGRQPAPGGLRRPSGARRRSKSARRFWVLKRT